MSSYAVADPVSWQTSLRPIGKCKFSASSIRDLAATDTFMSRRQQGSSIPSLVIGGSKGRVHVLTESARASSDMPHSSVKQTAHRPKGAFGSILWIASSKPAGVFPSGKAIPTSFAYST